MFANRFGRRLDPSAVRRRYERARDAAKLEVKGFCDPQAGVAAGDGRHQLSVGRGERVPRPWPLDAPHIARGEVRLR